MNHVSDGFDVMKNGTQYEHDREAANVAGRPAALLDTVESAAELLSLSRSSIYSLMETGQLRWKQIGAHAEFRTELERFALSDLTGGWAIHTNLQLSGAPQANDIKGVAEPCSHDTATTERTNGRYR